MRFAQALLGGRGRDQAASPATTAMSVIRISWDNDGARFRTVHGSRTRWPRRHQAAPRRLFPGRALIDFAAVARPWPRALASLRGGVSAGATAFSGVLGAFAVAAFGDFGISAAVRAPEAFAGTLFWRCLAAAVGKTLEARLAPGCFRVFAAGA